MLAQDAPRLLTGLTAKVGSDGVALAWTVAESRAQRIAGFSCVLFFTTFERLMGTATVTIADLLRPRVGVAIDVPGHDMGAFGAKRMP